MNKLLVFVLGLVAVSAAPPRSDRIIGGSVTTIQQYPFGAALLNAWGNDPFTQICGGTIINNRSILTAAHCVIPPALSFYRIRAGSTYANSGGSVHNVNRIVNHPQYELKTLDSDICVIRVSSNFIFSNSIRAGSISGPNYNLPDNASVWAIGWGRIAVNGPASEQLRHVNIWVVNQDTCRTRYAAIRRTITDNMLCSGWLDVGGRDQCQGDSGGPLIHNNVIVGVCSWGESCALPRYPGVNARVSRYTAWIQSQA